MSTAALLTLVQWLSPAFPLGSFAYSHGMETAVADGVVTDAESAQDWIRTVLRQGAGRQDAALLVAAMRAGPEDLPDLVAAARALAPSAERHQETEAQGAAFAETVSALTGRALQPMPLPLAVGVAAAPLGLEAEHVAAQYLQAFAANLVSCAVRSVPLGQTAGQRIVSALARDCIDQAQAATTTPWHRIGSAAFGSDLAAMRHETQEVRLYRT